MSDDGVPSNLCLNKSCTTLCKMQKTIFWLCYIKALTAICRVDSENFFFCLFTSSILKKSYSFSALASGQSQFLVESFKYIFQSKLILVHSLVGMCSSKQLNSGSFLGHFFFLNHFHSTAVLPIGIRSATISAKGI